MKKYVLPLLLLGTMASAQTLLSENFEGGFFPPGAWTRTSTYVNPNPAITRQWDSTDNNFGAGSTLETTFLISGAKSACIDWIAGANTADLISPTFSLVGAPSPIFKFKVKVGWSYMINQNAGNLIAQISTDGGTTWTTLWNEDSEPGFTDDGDTDPDTDLYNTVSVQRSLAAYIGQANVKVKFRYTGNDADAVSVDDVEVLGTTLGTNEVGVSKNYSLFPNPTKGAFSIKSADKISSIRVYDAAGKLVLENRNSNKGDISEFPTGVYYMNIAFADGTIKTEKLIKE